MKPSSLFSRPEFAPKTRQPVKDTAYWIFDKEQETSLAFTVSRAHLIMRNNQAAFPIATSANYSEKDAAEEMMPTRGRIIDMIDYYIDGAQIHMSPQTAAQVYRRLTNHLDTHIRAAAESKYYTPPPVDELKHMADFALAIHAWAKIGNPNLDGDKETGYHFENNWTRPTLNISRNNKGMEANLTTKNRVVPRPLRQRDSIEKLIDQIYGG